MVVGREDEFIFSSVKFLITTAIRKVDETATRRVVVDLIYWKNIVYIQDFFNDNIYSSGKSKIKCNSPCFDRSHNMFRSFRRHISHPQPRFFQYFCLVLHCNPRDLKAMLLACLTWWNINVITDSSCQISKIMIAVDSSENQY